MSLKSSARYMGFTNKEDYNLINIIQQHRLLYDVHNKEHRDLVVRARLWGVVSEKMNRSVEDCKKRWRSMKDTYFRFKRKNSKTTWVLMKRLKFLDGTARNSGPTIEEPNDQKEENETKEEAMPTIDEESNTEFQSEPSEIFQQPFDQTDETQSYEQDSISESKYRTSSLKYEDVLRLMEPNKQEQDLIKTDPIFGFFNSMALTVKNLPPELAVEAKIKICEIVGNLEMKAIKMNSEIDTSQIKIETDMSISEENIDFR